MSMLIVWLMLLFTISACSFERIRPNYSDDYSMVLVSTLDGHLRALDIFDGSDKWILREDPVLRAPRTVKQGFTFLPNPQDGSLYMLREGVLKKLPFSIPQLVHSSPCQGADGILYAGSKRDVWFGIDPVSGLKVETLSSTTAERFCPANHDRSVFIGRTEYQISMFDSVSKGKAWNASFTDYSAHLLPDDSEYPLKHYVSSSSGSILAVSGSGEIQWARDLKMPVVAMYLLKDDGLHKLSFTVLGKEAMENLAKAAYPQELWNNVLLSEPAVQTSLFPTLYVGDSPYGLYAISALVDQDTITYAPKYLGPPLLDGPTPIAISTDDRAKYVPSQRPILQVRSLLTSTHKTDAGEYLLLGVDGTTDSVYDSFKELSSDVICDVDLEEPEFVEVSNIELLRTFCGQSIGYFSKTAEFLTVSQAKEILSRIPPTRKPNSLPVSGAAGSLMFVHDHAENKLNDIVQDLFSPWNCHSKFAAKKTSEKYITGSLSAPSPSIYLARKAYHPIIPGLRRLVFYLKNSSAQKEPSGLFLVQYVFSTAGIETLSREKVVRQMPLPSSVARAKEILQKRSISSAQAILREEGHSMTKKTLSNIASANGIDIVKSKSGPRPITDPAKLVSLALEDPNFKVVPFNEQGKACIIGTYCFVDALRIFLNGCPDLYELKSRRKKIRKALKKASNGDSSKLEFLLAKSDASQRLPGLEACVYIDTTFSVCHLFVTLVYGATPFFRSRESGKNVSLLLAFSLHSTKKAGSHEALGKHLDEVMNQISPTALIPQVVTDNEIALQKVFMGSHFSEVIHSLCAVHLKTNLTSTFGGKGAQICFEKLTGKIREGRVIGGALNAHTEDDLQQNLEKLAQKYESLGAWISKARRFHDLHKYALFNRLLGGFSGQLCSSNVIEGKNSHLKLVIGRTQSGEDVIKTLMDVHSDEMKNCREALSLRSEKFAASEKILEVIESKGMDETVKLVGLPIHEVPEDLAKVIPTCCKKYYTVEVVSYLKDIHLSDRGDAFLLSRTGSDKFLVVQKVADFLHCTRDRCRKKLRKCYQLCKHVWTCAALINDENFWQCAVDLMNKRTSKQILASDVSNNDGKKRKGSKRTQSNFVRKVKSYDRYDSDDSSELSEQRPKKVRRAGPIDSHRRTEALLEREHEPDELVKTAVDDTSRFGRKIIPKALFTPHK